MDKIMEYAKIYSKQGFSVIPVDENKQPAIKSWYVFQKRPMTEQEVEKYFKDAYGIALLTGGKMKVTGLDFDLKYDLTGDLLKRYKQKVDISLLKKVLVNSTMNNGYHFIFTSPIIEGNQKLAQRETTDKEALQTYKVKRKEGLNVREAMNQASNDDVRVLIETRGGSEEKCGGYFVIPPTKGYQKLSGKLNHITEEEYDILMSAAREFNEYTTKKQRVAATQMGFSKDGNSPFDNFNEKGDILPILFNHGWTEVRQYSADVRLKRPGQSHSKSSALYDRNSNTLNVFTTSSSLEVGAHSPSDVFIQLECNGNVKEAYKRLLDLGYTDDRNKN